MPPEGLRSPGHRRLQPVRIGARRLGRSLPVVEHDPDPPRRARAAGSQPQSLPGGDLVGCLDPRHVRRRPDLPDQPAPAAIQPGIGGVLQRQLRALDRARGPVAVSLPRQRLRLRAAGEPGAPARARAGRRDVHRPAGRAGPRVPGVVRPGLPAGQPGERPRWGALRGRHVPRAGRASPVRARAVAGFGRLPPLARPRADLADPAEGRDELGESTAEPRQGRRPDSRRDARQSQRLVADDGPAIARRARLVRADRPEPAAPVERTLAARGHPGFAESLGAAPCPLDPDRDRTIRIARIPAASGRRPGPETSRAGDPGRPVQRPVRLPPPHRDMGPPGRRSRDPCPPAGGPDPGQSLPRRAGRARGARADRRPRRGRPLDAAGDPQRTGRVGPGLHPPVRQDRGLRGPLRPALAVRRDRRGSQPCRRSWRP